MKRKLIALGVLFSLLIYPEVWVRMYGFNFIQQGLVLARGAV